MSEGFEAALAELPLVAILRGVRPEEAEAVGGVLVEAGFRLIEVPLNSPEPCRSIEVLSRAFGEQAVIGAGTVLETGKVLEVARAGGRLIVMPHADTAVIRAAVGSRLICMPGAATPTEGFAALAAGARALKMFPAEVLGPAALKAWRAVFPPQTRFFPVGGVTPDTMAPWRAAGAAGFGIGGALFTPGVAPDELRRRARAFVAAWAELAPAPGR